jgi:hypothetical protein
MGKEIGLRLSEDELDALSYSWDLDHQIVVGRLRMGAGAPNICVAPNDLELPYPLFATFILQVIHNFQHPTWRMDVPSCHCRSKALAVLDRILYIDPADDESPERED